MFSLLDKWPNLELENSKILIFLLMSLLLRGILICILVLWPRGDRFVKRVAGIIDPVSIAQSSCDEFIKHVSNADQETIYKQAQDLTWDVNRIDRSKYRTLDYALKASVVAWFVAVLVISYIASSRLMANKINPHVCIFPQRSFVANATVLSFSQFASDLPH